ncbi:LOW QUALITY PROTEIN: ubinuclein-1 [Phoenix dactylifera]|uniref:LOW QUALITY PROTEIN: ubinuclein-1 n=1 Tax=Phoenix dactylifera TaxID=42345 RepID=A0A8B7BQJ2_PHODC|nr:LOW QUALITY PROTEIN: ubinuclein-1 [Phoenix dactylifera]
MDEDKGGTAIVAARASSSSSTVPSAPPPAVSSSSNPPKEAPPPPPPVPATERQRFSVELRPGETTIVSWKKLLRESGKGTCFPSFWVDPALGPPAAAAAATVENELKDAVPPPNRFSAVIEKIERLYVGKQSSDEEDLDDTPDDDQYDTEDSFIDDAELDEYFQVDKLRTKHDGYFVNKGKLEHVEPMASPDVAPKKRRRKESTKVRGERDHDHVPSESINMGNMRIKAAARNAPLVGKKLSSPAKVLALPYVENYYEENKLADNKLNAPTGAYNKRSAVLTINLENPPSVKLPNKDISSLPLESKDFDNHKAGLMPSDLTHKSRGTGDSFDPMYQTSRDKGVSSQVEFQSRRLLNGENEEVSAKIRRKEKYGTGEFSDMNSSGSVYTTQAQPTFTRVKEGSTVRPKGTTLERAIRDLEKIVAESRPPSIYVQETVQEIDPSSQGVKRRLPQEVKQKLAKVARLSASQAKVSEDELIDRLMGILGHLVQRKTLKRNMKEMVELGLSAKQQKADRFQQTKKEVHELIRARVSNLNSHVAELQDISADDFQEVINNDERRALKGKYSMDTALEDKICDLYDLYVEGMDEDKGPQSRKLYVELAELWPHGYMDNVGIKDAIYRSKERKRALYRQNKVRDEERIKRKKLAAAVRVEETNPGPASQARAGQERPVTDPTGPFLVSPDKLVSNQLPASLGRITDPTPLSSDSGQQHVLKNPDKAKGGSMSVIPDDGSKAVVDMKKKMKRKSESDLGEIHVHPLKVPSQHTKERHKSEKLTDDTDVSQQSKPSIPLPGVPDSDQAS